MFAEPGVDFDEVFLSFEVVVWLVGQAVVAFIDSQPAHAGLTYGVGELQRGDPGEVVGEGIDEHVRLHAGNFWNAVIVQSDAGFEGGRGKEEAGGFGGFQVIFHFADELGVLIEQGAFVGVEV